MKAVTIKFTNNDGNIEKTFVTCTLKAGKMDQLFEIAERAKCLEDEDIDLKSVKAFFCDLNGFIVGVFNHQFTLDELREGAEQSEIMSAFMELCNRITGEFQKN